jgi:hypothetical protein
MKDFLQPNAVCIRFAHIVNMQPKLYVGSATHSSMDREHSRTRKYFQLEHNKLVRAEFALRFWRDHQNLLIWAPIPIFVLRGDYDFEVCFKNGSLD